MNKYGVGLGLTISYSLVKLLNNNDNKKSNLKANIKRAQSFGLHFIRNLLKIHLTNYARKKAF